MNGHALELWLLVTVCCCLISMSYAEGQPARFPSPKGRFEVAFESPLPYVYLDPDKAAPTQGLKSVSYQIAFYPPGRTTNVAITDYFDIYTSSPTPVQEIVKSILWSPEEDIAILPAEKWPRASKNY